jgi:hypothetical protein
VTATEVALERYLDALEIIATSTALTDDEIHKARTLPVMVTQLCAQLIEARELVTYFKRKAKPRPCVKCKHMPSVVRTP